MRLKGFYYVYGNDTDMIEKRWFPDLESKYPEARWLRYDATLDDVNVDNLTMEYYSNSLFNPNTVIVIRNADVKQAEVTALAEQLVVSPVSDNALVLIAGGWNKTTKLGKSVKKYFIAKEFSREEIKPFDLLDALNVKKGNKVLQFANLLFEADYNPLALFSLIFGHLLLLRKIKELEGEGASSIARKLGIHNYRIQKTMPACRFWTQEDIKQALQEMGRVDTLIRTCQYDQKMLVQMALIKLCL